MILNATILDELPTNGCVLGAIAMTFLRLGGTNGTLISVHVRPCPVVGKYFTTPITRLGFLRQTGLHLDFLCQT